MNNVVKNSTTDKDIKFNYFINKTIILASKWYYKKTRTMSSKEVILAFDSEAEHSTIMDTSALNSCLDFVENDVEIKNAVSMLSDIEQAVIFLLFRDDLNQDEAAKILNICSKSVSRIKLRALCKMKKYLKGDK